MLVITLPKVEWKTTILVIFKSVIIMENNLMAKNIITEIVVTQYFQDMPLFIDLIFRGLRF